MKNIGTLIFGLVVAYYLFIPAQIGLADSADFGRVTTRLGLGRPFNSSNLNFFNFFNSNFPIESAAKIPISINQVIAYMALMMNKVFYSKSFFSIYFLSGLYYIAYLLGFYLLFKNIKHHFRFKTSYSIFIIFAILIFSDVMFISYFNSFYQESVFLISGLFILAISVKKEINYNYLVIALLILSLSKIQNLLYLIFPIGLVFLNWQRLNKILILACLIFLISFLFVQLKQQQQTNEANLYEAVFLGVLLKATKNEQTKILNENGLKDPNYLKNVGRGYWRPKNDLYEYNLNKEFYGKLSNWSIVKMYMANPKLFIKTGIEGIHHLTYSSAQPEHLGNLSWRNSPGSNKTIIKTFLGKYLHKFLIPGYLLILIFYTFQGIYFGLKKDDWIAFSLLIFIPLVFIANFVAGGINDFVKHNLSVYFMYSILMLVFFLKLFQLNRFKYK